jgi:hypothetical protein
MKKRQNQIAVPTVEKPSVALAFVGLVFTGMVVAVALHAADYAYRQVYDASGFRDR